MRRIPLLVAATALGASSSASAALIAGSDFSDSTIFNQAGGAYDIVNVDDLNLTDSITVSATWGFTGGGMFEGFDTNAQAGMPDDNVTKLDGNGNPALGMAGDPLPTSQSAFFEITIPLGTIVDLTSVTFNWRQATGPGNTRALAFGTDIDGILAFKELGLGRNDFDAETVDLSGAQYQGLTDTTVRFSWFAGEGTGTGDIDLDTIILNGNVSVVPEPTALDLSVLGVLALAFSRRRRRLPNRPL